MENYDLSILIPARNEMFLSRTVEDLLKNIRGNTEIIVVLDGEWADPPINDHDRITIIYRNKSIGQRAATNEACRLSKAKYVMKVDAHCAFDEGFDVKMVSAMQDDWTMAPKMYNFHVFDWVCPDGHRRYQGPRGVCKECGKETTRDIIWKPRLSRETYAYRFDKTLHFQYWGDYKKRQVGDLVESMSLQGSCWMLTRKKYWELDICDEKHGGWGQQGVEVACKTWLSGGKVIINKRTWYAHMFRTQGGDFGFPYSLSQRDIDKAREYSKWLFLEGNWPKAKYDLNWLLQKFYPVPDWHDTKPKEAPVVTQAGSSPKKAMLFYTDNQLTLKVAHPVQKQLQKISDTLHIPIISVSLKPMDFGKNISFNLPRGYLTMSKQIVAGLEATDAEIIFMCEHDVLYHPFHFLFTPAKKDVYYYNTNVWRVRLEDGHALFCKDLRQLSGMCTYRETMLAHVRERVRRLEEKLSQTNDEHEYNHYVREMGFEPGTHKRPERIDDFPAENYMSEYPNLDIRHGGNLTPSRWIKEQFRNERFTEGWTEQETVAPWNWESGKFLEFLKKV